MANFSSSDVSRLKLDVCDVSLVASQQHASQIIQDSTTLARTRGPQPLARVSDIRNTESPSLMNRHPSRVSMPRGPHVSTDWDNKHLIRTPLDNEAFQRISMPSSNQLAQPLNIDQKYSHIRVEASVSSVSYQRDRLCLCQCHQVTTMATPGDWSRILGRLFVGYAGLPLLSKKCDRKSCQHGQVQTRIRVAYLFPFWFALRLFALTITKASTSFMWKLDFPAVTSSNSDLFVQASLGNIDKIQGILSMDSGAFNVIDSVANKSPLHVRM